MNCNLCPRRCNVNREKQKGYCSANNNIFVAKYMLHHWEEPIISGDIDSMGSGAIFFSGCNLKCIYCQNYEISNSSVGKELTIPDLVNIFKLLENKGAHNINLVTSTHYQKQIIEALNLYKPSIPIVWNSSGYETVEQITELKNYVDIYLVDYKYSDKSLAEYFSSAKDYPEIAQKAIVEMKKNQPIDIVENGLMKKGVIIRHLVLPNCVQNTLDCLDWIKSKFGTNQYISVMAQYTPCYKALYNEIINRPLHKIEYKRVLNKLDSLGFINGFYQNLESANCTYTPDFSKYSE